MKLIVVSAMTLALAQGVARNPSQVPAGPPLPAVPRTAAISGSVIDAVTKEPLEDVSVALASVAGSSTARWQQFTDAKGRFVFVNLPAGERYTLAASAPGFVDGGYSRDAVRPLSTMTNIALNQDQWIKDLLIPLQRPGSITGRVVDEVGEPMVGVFVRALRRERAGGRDVYAVGPMTMTDDTGAYRLSSLDPGRYVISVPSVTGQMPSPMVGGSIVGRYPWRAPSSSEARPSGYAPTFYPGAKSPGEAQAIDVAPAQVRSGVDVSLRAVPLFRVSGTIPGVPAPLSLRLVPEGSDTLGVGGDAAVTITAPDGSFTFDNVPAGSYVFETARSVQQLSTRRTPGALFGDPGLPAPPRPGGPGGSSTNGLTLTMAAPDVSLQMARYGSNADTPAFLARTVIGVGGTDISGLVVPLEIGGSFSGRVTWEPDPDKPDLKPTSFDQFLTLEPAGRNPNQLRMIDTASGVFKDASVNPGEYFVRQRGNATNWLIKSVIVEGGDHSTRPVNINGAMADVVVTLTSRGASITGTVKETRAAVILFPQDQSQWTGYGFNPPNMRIVDTSTTGTYTFNRLPAGDYCVVAIDPASRLDWIESGFFAAASPLATRVTVNWGETKNAAISVVAVRR